MSHESYVSIFVTNTADLVDTKAVQYLDYVKIQGYDDGIRNPQTIRRIWMIFSKAVSQPKNSYTEYRSSGR